MTTIFKVASIGNIFDKG